MLLQGTGTPNGSVSSGFPNLRSGIPTPRFASSQYMGCMTTYVLLNLTPRFLVSTRGRTLAQVVHYCQPARNRLIGRDFVSSQRRSKGRKLCRVGTFTWTWRARRWIYWKPMMVRADFLQNLGRLLLS